MRCRGSRVCSVPSHPPWTQAHGITQRGGLGVSQLGQEQFRTHHRREKQPLFLLGNAGGSIPGLLCCSQVRADADTGLGALREQLDLLHKSRAGALGQGWRDAMSVCVRAAFTPSAQDGACGRVILALPFRTVIEQL